MCCSLTREAVRAATHYYMRALAKGLNTGTECYIVIVIYLRQTKLSCFSLFEEKKKAEIRT